MEGSGPVGMAEGGDGKMPRKEIKDVFELLCFTVVTVMQVPREPVPKPQEHSLRVVPLPQKVTCQIVRQLVFSGVPK